MQPVDEVEGIARHANARPCTMGMARSSCSLPQTRHPGFDLPVDEMEIGMGIHDEPGVRRGRLRPAAAETAPGKTSATPPPRVSRMQSAPPPRRKDA